MKYIRTKDGVGVYGGNRHDDYTGDSYIKVFNSRGLYKEYLSIVAEADTIEKLCDYEMHYDNNGEFVIRPIKQVDWQSLKRVIVNKWFKDCKLAVKTDKGLIYVAQMNDKGELELL